MPEENQPDFVQFENYIRDSFARRELPMERCSQILFSQLARMPAYRGLNYPFQFVEREIMHLEGLADTTTKPAMPFRRNGKLAGFMHKHFCVPGYEHLAVNTQLAWEFGKPDSRKFVDMALKIAKPYADVEQTREELLKFSGEIAEAIAYGPGGLQDRQASGKTTGDWIIYASHKGKNYYLCISKHDEDEFILEALKSCAAEYPFVAVLLDSCAGA